MEEFYEMVSTKKYNQLEILMKVIEDMSFRSYDYGRKAEDIELVNIYGNPLEGNINYLRAIKNKSRPILNKLHELFLENYKYNYNDPITDCLFNPLTTHNKFLNEIYFNIKNRLETNEEYKMIQEQKKMQQEEEDMRRLMELEKLFEEQKIKMEKLLLKKKEKLHCSVCGLLISKNNMSVHKKMKKCINFGKEKQGEEDIALLDEVEITTETTTEEKIPKDSFKCDCGMIQKKSNKTNHQNTKKCQRKRGLIE